MASEQKWIRRSDITSMPSTHIYFERKSDGIMVPKSLVEQLQSEARASCIRWDDKLQDFIIPEALAERYATAMENVANKARAEERKQIWSDVYGMLEQVYEGKWEYRHLIDRLEAEIEEVYPTKAQTPPRNDGGDIEMERTAQEKRLKQL